MNADIFSSSATDTNFSSFWNLTDATSSTISQGWWHYLSGALSDLWMWDFKWEDKATLPAHELTIHGKPRGKLRPPKLKTSKGFKHMYLHHEYSGNRGRGNT